MAFTSADLDTIDRAIATGELTIRGADGRTVTFRTMEELIVSRNTIKAEIDAASNTARLYPRHQMADFSDD